MAAGTAGIPQLLFDLIVYLLMIIAIRKQGIALIPIEKRCSQDWLHRFFKTVFQSNTRTGSAFDFQRSSLKYASPRLVGGSFSRFFRRETTTSTAIVTRYGSILKSS